MMDEYEFKKPTNFQYQLLKLIKKYNTIDSFKLSQLTGKQHIHVVESLISMEDKKLIESFCIKSNGEEYFLYRSKYKTV